MWSVARCGGHLPSNMVLSCVWGKQYTRNLRTVKQATKDLQKKIIPPVERRLDVVIMGSPNAGKSVLLNTLLKQKLAATSRKRHTTRSEILGVFNYKNTQLAFFDTPGYVDSKESRKKDVVVQSEIVVESCSKADVILLVVDAARTVTDRVKDTFSEICELAIKSAKKEVILVLNKIDMVKNKYDLLDITREFVSLINGLRYGEDRQLEANLDVTTFMISGLHNDGVLDVKNYLISIADPKKWSISSQEGITHLTMNERVEQIALEALLDNVHDEIPYTAEIECTKIEEYMDFRTKVYITISVDTNRQQKICIGHNGRTMLSIRQHISQELEKIFNKQVLCFLNIASRTTNQSKGAVATETDETIEDGDDYIEEDLEPATKSKGTSPKRSSFVSRPRTFQQKL